MKLNKDFLIHQTDNGEILIPVGDETKRFHGVVKLNETGSEIVHLLEDKEMSLEELLEYFYNKYPEDNKEDIEEGVTSFVNKLREINAITF